MDLIADINHSLRADWVFIVMLLIMIYLVFLQWRFKDEFRLFSRAFFSLKASSQLHGKAEFPPLAILFPYHYRGAFSIVER